MSHELSWIKNVTETNKKNVTGKRNLHQQSDYIIILIGFFILKD